MVQYDKMKKSTIICLSALFAAMSSFAQEQEEQEQQPSADTQAYIAVDMVSQYIWRGFDYGGVSIQPAMVISGKGFSFAAYGSAGFDTDETKTFGLSLSYKVKGLWAKLTDFWYSDAYTPLGKFPSTYFEYDARKTTHVYEASSGYDFKFLSVEWYTIFGGNDFFKPNDKRSYSSYFELSAPFRISAVDFKVHLGVTPWEGYYADGFNVVNTGVKASKTFYVGDKLAIPVSTQIIVNPYAEQVCMFAGVGFWL
jgi:hypothetical protein